MPFDYLALDASARAYGKDDGRLYVKVSHISKACVNPYYGREIPKAQALGLNPDQVYMLLRDPEELALSVPTWNGLPLLIKHVPMTADDHQRDVVVGSLGTDAAFRAPYLDNSLAIWDGEAIAGIESGDLRQLSGGYQYDADMTPGDWNSEHYDGVMRNIRGNHVALVESGRAGNDVLVMDAAMETGMVKKSAGKPRMVAAISPRDLVLAGALQAYSRPIMAKDAAMPDYQRLVVGAKNTKEVASRVRTALKPVIAQDANLSDLENMIDGLKGTEGPAMLPAIEKSDDSIDPEQFGDPEETNVTEDDDLEAKIHELLDGKLDDADIAMLMKLISPDSAGTPADPDSDGVMENPEKAPADPDNDGAVENPFGKKDDDDAKDRRVARDRRRVGRDETPDDMEDKVDKSAMDAAIRAATAVAVREAVNATTKKLDERNAAERFVKPWVGEIVTAMDSAASVYKFALDKLGVNVSDVHPSAYKVILENLPRPGDEPRARRQAMDSAGAQDFNTRWPGAARIRVVG